MRSTVPNFLRSPVHRFALATILGGAALFAGLGASGAFAPLIDPPATLVLLFALTIATDFVELKVPRSADDVTLSPSQVFAFALLLMHGAGPAVAAWSLAMLASDLSRGRPPLKIAFNTSQIALSMAAGGAALELAPLMGTLGATALACVTIFAVNNVLAVGVSLLAQGLRFREWLAHEPFSPFVFDGLLLAYGPVVYELTAHRPELLPLTTIPFVGLLLSAREAEQRRHESLHDALTGLPNRAYLEERIARELCAGERGGAAVLFDLDRFREINDALGHGAGDKVLREIGARLQAAAAPEGFVARFGGDEFAVFVSGDPREGLNGYVRRVREVFEESVATACVHVSTAASVGVAPIRAGDRAEALLRRADVALGAAKADGGVAFYQGSHDVKRPERLALLGELRQGIRARELEVHYQPKVSLDDGAVRGAEALVRWRHPQRGLIGPGEFIELAESTDLMEPLTLAVLSDALDEAARLRASGHAISIAVNLAAPMLLDRRLAGRIGAMLAARSLDGTALRLEITERTLMREPEVAAEVLEELSEIGVDVSIDDFGTGYSSLTLLQRLPVRELKIDRSFVTEVGSNRPGAAIVASIAGLGRALGMEVVAEGVETEQEFSVLSALGCDHAQGYLISRPLPADEFEQWLDDREAAEPASGERALAATRS